MLASSGSESQPAESNLPASEVSRPVRLPRKALVQIERQFASLPQQTELKTFSALGDGIIKATGELSSKATVALNQVAKDFIVTHGVMSFGVAKVSATLRNYLFLVFDYVATGEIPQDVLSEMQSLCRALNTDFVKSIETFSTKAASNFTVVFTEFLEQHGGNFAQLKLDRDEQAGMVEAEEIKLNTMVSAEADALGKIAFFESDLKFAELAVSDADQARADMQAELKRLRREELPLLEEELLKKRDTHEVHRGHFAFISWRTRSIHLDNGERLVRENIVRCEARIAALDQRLREFKLETERNRISAAKDCLKTLNEKLPHLKAVREAQGKTVTDMKAVLRKLEDDMEVILARAQTRSPRAINQANELAKTIFAASVALTNASAQFTSELGAIRESPTAIMCSTLAAMTLYKLCQDYLHNEQALPNLKSQFLLMADQDSEDTK